MKTKDPKQGDLFQTQTYPSGEKCSNLLRTMEFVFGRATGRKVENAVATHFRTKHGIVVNPKEVLIPEMTFQTLVREVFEEEIRSRLKFCNPILPGVYRLTDVYPKIYNRMKIMLVSSYELLERYSIDEMLIGSENVVILEDTLQTES